MAGTEQESQMPRAEHEKAGVSALAWLAVGCSLAGFLCVIFIGINSHHLLSVLGFSFGMALLAVGMGFAAMIRGRRSSRATFQFAAAALLLAAATATLVIYILVALASTGD